jgi:hypothetical protein
LDVADDLKVASANKSTSSCIWFVVFKFGVDTGVLIMSSIKLGTEMPMLFVLLSAAALYMPKDKKNNKISKI